MSRAVYTLADMDEAAALQPPARLAVVGDPVAHSRSPQMHNPALHERGLAGQYVRLHARPDEFPAAVRRARELGFWGLNCTIPHKVAALQAADEVDPQAARLGVVNTLVFRGEKVLGFNSDGPGLLRALQEEFGIQPAGRRVLILGAGGGAGRAAAIQCALAGCDRLLLANRTLEKAERLADELTGFFPRERLELLRRPDAAEADLIINASSVGMKPEDPPLLEPGQILERHCVYDMIYHPAETPLLRLARDSGARAANGLSMLLHQGAVSFEHWFGPPAPLDAMRRGLQQA